MYALCVCDVCVCAYNLLCVLLHDTSVSLGPDCLCGSVAAPHKRPIISSNYNANLLHVHTHAHTDTHTHALLDLQRDISLLLLLLSPVIGCLRLRGCDVGPNP